MTRHYPAELHIGQRVYVQPSQSSLPVRALVTAIDNLKGLVVVTVAGSKTKWSAHPKAIMSFTGLHLHFEDNRFIFKSEPFVV